MYKTLIWLLCACSIVCSYDASGQHIKVSDPVLEMRDNTIHITYDILNSTPSEEFTVELVVNDANGKQIHAAALSGDVGDMVTGGNGKHITWNLEADRIEMNGDIFVKVYVKAIRPPVTVVVPPVVEEVKEGEDENQVSREETKPETKPTEEESKEKTTKETAVKTPATASGEIHYNRTSLIFQSVAFPGLGLSRHKGGPHWIRGVLGYSCIAGSLILNGAAVNTYDRIIDKAGFDAKNSVYQKSLQQDQISEVLAYTAIAIWVSDLVWTLAGTSDLNKRTSLQSGPRINPTIDPVSHAPLIVFTYRF